MRHAKWCALVALALGGFACGDNVTGETPQASLVSLSISPPTAHLDIGGTRSFTVTGSFDDGTLGPVTSGVSWQSSAPAIATVEGGTVTAVAMGSATITASVGSIRGTAEVTVGEVASVAGVVFDDGFGADIDFAAFEPSTDLAVTTAEKHSGASSLALQVPATNYAGGAFRVPAPADLSGYNALVFWVKASKTASLNVVGIGNNAVTTAYMTEWNAVPLTTEWTRHVIPLPLPARLTAEAGLFHFAEGAEEGAYTIWFDDIAYASLDAAELGTPAPAIATEAVTKLVGDAFAVNGASVTYTLGGAPRTMAIGRRYLTFASSDTAVATVDPDGRVAAVAVGAATITAKLGDVDAIGALAVTVTDAVTPLDPAPAPTLPGEDVIALFSDAYTTVPVDTWRTDWSSADLADVVIGTDNAKKYSNLNFVGIEFFRTASVDATTMSHVHLDVWVPFATTFKVKLVDFGADGAFAGGDDREHELAFDATTTPALTPGAWSSLEIPLEAFTGLTTRGHLAQLILSSTSQSTAYVDNVYFHRTSAP
jgi:hypothetical protein